jgi:hypothetical protein
VRRPSARSFSEEGEILSESLVRILTGLNRDLEGLLRATTAMRPYFGQNEKDEKFPHLLLQLNKALDVSGAERRGSAGGYLPSSPLGFLVRRPNRNWLEILIFRVSNNHTVFG